ncbi:MAG: porphobilinogen synthase [Verrucomicrobia bacterium]|nr:porphobilinogen synthase [Verrucomicrobiota bacterium]MDA1339917.1 porphobilinogen synthase [Verrucomicrobiota bacterium]
MKKEKFLQIPIRSRRLRRTEGIRRLFSETRVTPSRLVAPLFVIEGNGKPESIPSLPGHFRFPIPTLIREAQRLARRGIGGIAIFPCIAQRLRTPTAREALNPKGLIVRAIRRIKKELPGLPVFADVALDPYTSHGHDGLLNRSGRDVDNDSTVPLLMKQATLLADAGADFVAPSDMMDGRIGYIRQALDQAGYSDTGILSYAAKFASALYGPFRDAVGSAQTAGTHSLDKRGYQADPANRNAILRDALLDETEGADLLMVKPAGLYLDILRDLRENTRLPLAAYQVSGEYAQIYAAAQKGWVDLKKARDESLLSIHRAGADIIFTYFAKDL